MANSRQYVFGEFRLDAVQRALFRANDLVPLAPKALETLLFLVERHGRIVDKKELMDAVWPETFVEEVSLARNVSVLRKVLSENEDGQSYIETIPKRGYRFVAPVSEEQQDEAVASSLRSSKSSGLPSTPAQTGESGEDARKRTPWRSWAIAPAIVVAGLAGFAYWLTSSRPALSFAKRDWILIADFENRTGDPRFDKALLTALTVDLEQSRYGNVFPRSRMYETLKRMGQAQDATAELTITEALGREICLRENLRALVATSLTRTGKEYLLIGRLVDPKTGSTVRSYTKRIDQEDGILDALDSVAGSIRHDLGETLYSIRRDERPLAKVTTSSLAALQHYSEAVELWRKGKYMEAQAHLQEALRIDPDFAMAHSALGSNLYSHILSDPKRGKEEYELALQLSGRVTDRERMFILASFADFQGQSEEAERLYRAFLGTYPDDLPARFNLATHLLRFNRCDEAIAQYLEIIRINPSEVNARINIGTCYGNQSKYSEALPYYARAFEIDPSRLTTGGLNHEYGFVLVGAGQSEKARELFARMLENSEWRARGLRSLGLLDLYEGRYREAEARFQEAIPINEMHHDELPAVRNRLYLATTLSVAGDHKGALRALDQASQSASKLQRVNWLAYRIGVAYARAGAIEKADQILEVAKKGAAVDQQADRSDADRLEGEILLVRDDTTHAVQVLEQAHRENHAPLTPLTLDSLARAYEKSGQIEQAISSYEALVSMQGGNALGWETQQPWLEAHYALAKLQASRGNATKAIELLDRLLGIWKNADPEVPLVKQARSLRESLNR